MAHTIVFSLTTRAGETLRYGELVTGYAEPMRVASIQELSDEDGDTDSFQVALFEQCPRPGCDGYLINVSADPAKPRCECPSCGGAYRGGRMAGKHVVILRTIRSEDVLHWDYAGNDVEVMRELTAPEQPEPADAATIVQGAPDAAAAG